MWIAKSIFVMYIRHVSAGGPEEDEFLALLDSYLDVSHDPNPTMANVRVVWVEHDPGVGALHIARHNVTKAEVEQVLFEVPPWCRRSGHDNARTARCSGGDAPGPLDLRSL
jgi:hypothetical protein